VRRSVVRAVCVISADTLHAYQTAAPDEVIKAAKPPAKKKTLAKKKPAAKKKAPAKTKVPAKKGGRTTVRLTPPPPPPHPPPHTPHRPLRELKSQPLGYIGEKGHDE
jgi:hypothetical protein